LFSDVNPKYHEIVTLFVLKIQLHVTIQLNCFCTSNLIRNETVNIQLPSWGACWNRPAKNSCHSDWLLPTFPRDHINREQKGSGLTAGWTMLDIRA